MKRLLNETKELSAAAAKPNPAFFAAPISDDNLHEWHFTLLGPPAPSPYAGGIYHGRITLPPAYPMKPPNFRFLTPSGRFEVNREICLSISGFHEETWQPAWGVRTALVALRGFMGEEGTAGQVGGLESTKEVRERLAKQSRSWACPSCGGDEEGDNRKGWTNEERLSWWWDLCRKKGVNVEEECEGMEALADGLKLETREVKQIEDKGKEKAADSPSAGGPVHPASTTAVAESVCLPSQAAHICETTPATLARQRTIENIATNAQAQSSTPNAREGATNTPTSSESTLNPQQQIQQAQLTQLQQPLQQTESPITIDRAITVVLLALFIMILKKMFYPSSSGTLGYDDLRLMRD